MTNTAIIKPFVDVARDAINAYKEDLERQERERQERDIATANLRVARYAKARSLIATTYGIDHNWMQGPILFHDRYVFCDISAPPYAALYVIAACHECGAPVYEDNPEKPLEYGYRDTAWSLVELGRILSENLEYRVCTPCWRRLHPTDEKPETQDDPQPVKPSASEALAIALVQFLREQGFSIERDDD